MSTVIEKVNNLKEKIFVSYIGSQRLVENMAMTWTSTIYTSTFVLGCTAEI